MEDSDKLDERQASNVFLTFCILVGVDILKYVDLTWKYVACLGTSFKELDYTANVHNSEGIPFIAFKSTDIKVANLSTTDFINRQAFYDCTELLQINAPKLTFIGGEAFQDCTSIKILSFPNVTEADSESQFYNCTSLKKLELPKLNKFDKGHDYGSLAPGCTNLKEVVFNEDFIFEMMGQNMGSLITDKSEFVDFINSDRVRADFIDNIVAGERFAHKKIKLTVVPGDRRD